MNSVSLAEKGSKQTGGEDNTEKEAGTGAIGCQSKAAGGGPQPPEAGEPVRSDSSLRSSGRAQLCQAPIADSWPPDL